MHPRRACRDCIESVMNLSGGSQPFLTVERVRGGSPSEGFIAGYSMYQCKQDQLGMLVENNIPLAKCCPNSRQRDVIHLGCVDRDIVLDFPAEMQ